MTRARVVSRRIVYRGRIIRLVREVLSVQGQRIVRETVEHPGAVVIVPLIDRSHVLLVRQYRRAIDRELLELPAGTVERGETQYACAQRELAEETGWRARRLQRLAQFYPSPGVLSEQMTLFLARGLRKAAPAARDPDEHIHPVALSFRQALGRVRSGAIRDAKAILGILMTRDVLRGRSHR